MNNTRIKDIPLVDRPRERLLLYGASNLSNEELLSIILKTGNKNESVKSISNNVDVKVIGNNSVNSKENVEKMISTGVDGFSIARSIISGNLDFNIANF